MYWFVIWSQRDLKKKKRIKDDQDSFAPEELVQRVWLAPMLTDEQPSAQFSAVSTASERAVALCSALGSTVLST